MLVTPSPDSNGALWRTAANGREIAFGKPADMDYLSLSCRLSADAPPQLGIIRHAQSQPGAKALFAVMGNGMISRLNLDAALLDDGWRWEGIYPASAPELEVFTGPRDIVATLPGAGRLEIAGSALPREFIEWCRRNGEALPQPQIDLLSSSSPDP